MKLALDSMYNLSILLSGDQVSMIVGGKNKSDIVETLCNQNFFIKGYLLLSIW